MPSMLLSAAEAVALIRPGDAITTSGFVGAETGEDARAFLAAQPR